MLVVLVVLVVLAVLAVLVAAAAAAVVSESTRVALGAEVTAGGVEVGASPSAAGAVYLSP